MLTFLSNMKFHDLHYTMEHNTYILVVIRYQLDRKIRPCWDTMFGRGRNHWRCSMTAIIATFLPRAIPGLQDAKSQRRITTWEPHLLWTLHCLQLVLSSVAPEHIPSGIFAENTIVCISQQIEIGPERWRGKPICLRVIYGRILLSTVCIYSHHHSSSL